MASTRTPFLPGDTAGADVVYAVLTGGHDRRLTRPGRIPGWGHTADDPFGAAVRDARRWRRRHPRLARADLGAELPDTWHSAPTGAHRPHPLFADQQTTALRRRPPAPLGADPSDPAWRWLRGRGSEAAEVGALVHVAGLASDDVAAVVDSTPSRVGTVLHGLDEAAGAGHLDAAGRLLAQRWNPPPASAASRRRPRPAILGVGVAVAIAVVVAAVVVVRPGPHPSAPAAQSGGGSGAVGFATAHAAGDVAGAPSFAPPNQFVPLGSTLMAGCRRADLVEGDTTQGGTGGSILSGLTLVNRSAHPCALTIRPRAHLVYPGGATRAVVAVASQPGPLQGLLAVAPGTVVSLTLVVTAADCGAPSASVAISSPVAEPTLVVRLPGGVRRWQLQPVPVDPCAVHIGGFVPATG